MIRDAPTATGAAGATSAAPKAIGSTLAAPSGAVSAQPQLAAQVIGVFGFGTVGRGDLDPVKPEDVVVSFTDGQEVFVFVNFDGARPNQDRFVITLSAGATVYPPLQMLLIKERGFQSVSFGKLPQGSYKVELQRDGAPQFVPTAFTVTQPVAVGASGAPSAAPTAAPRPNATTALPGGGNLFLNVGMVNSNPVLGDFVTVKATVLVGTSAINARGVPGATLSAEWRFKNHTERVCGENDFTRLQSGSDGLMSCTRLLDLNEVVDFKVIVAVTVTYQGQSITSLTDFTPATKNNSGADPTLYHLSAQVSNARPTLGSTITLTAELDYINARVNPIPDVLISAEWRYRDHTEMCSGVSNTSGQIRCSQTIRPDEIVGYTVVIKLTATHNGVVYTATTEFTPVATAATSTPVPAAPTPTRPPGTATPVPTAPNKPTPPPATSTSAPLATNTPLAPATNTKVPPTATP